MAAIALPDSLNPTLIAGALYLAGGRHPLRRTAAFTAGAFLVTFAGGVVIALGLGQLVLSILPEPDEAVKYSLFVAGGAVLVSMGVAIWLGRGRLAREKPPDAELKSGAPAFLLGVGIAGFELLTAFPYFAAIALVVGSGVSVPEKVVALLVFNILYVLPLIGIVVVCAVMGPRADRVLTPFRNWLVTRWPHVVGPTAVVFGLAVMAYGVVNLV